MARPTRHRNKYRIRWIDENGKRRSEVHTKHADAQQALRKRQAEAEEIRRGLRPRPPSERTFAELCDYWLSTRAKQKRSGADDASIIRVHLLPAFGSLALTELTVERIDRFVAERGHLAAQTIRNHLTVLGAMLTKGVELGWLVEKPKIRKPKVRLFGSEYRWLRTRDDINRFLAAALTEGPLVHAVYATAVYTGMRAGELVALQWSDVDLDRRLITVQRSHDGPTKGGDVRYVPILDVLFPILKAWKTTCSGVAVVFPNRAGKKHEPRARIMHETLGRVLTAAGLPMVEINGKMRAHVRFHDLRHSFASHWVMQGGDLFRLQKILGHKSTELTMRYAHLAPNAFAGDLSRLS